MRVRPLLIIATLASAPAASAQTVIEEVPGASAGLNWGRAVAFVGDVNSDGCADFLVGSPGDDAAGTDAGSATLLSGLDRSTLQHWDGPLAGSEFGAAVDGVGDIDSDGVPDVIIGAPGTGEAFVYSGLDGTQLHWLAPATALGFGTSVLGLGRASADGVPDFAVGGTDAQGLWAFSGTDANPLWSSMDTARDLGALGDVNGDGYDDLIAGDYTHGTWGTGGGIAQVLSGLDGSVIRQVVGDDSFTEHLGRAVAGLGDLDGDGVGDYCYSVPCVCFATHYIRIHSGATGSWIDDITEYTTGWDVASAGDLDLDGVPDILVCPPGEVQVWSGATRTKLWTIGTGAAVAGGMDANGDGYLDFLAGDPLDDLGGAAAGLVGLYTVGCPYPAPVNYCAAVANSTGVPARMHYQNSYSVAANDFRLWCDGLPTGQFGIFFYGSSPAAIPFGDGVLCIGPPMIRLNIHSTGPSTPAEWVDVAHPPQASGQISPGETWQFSFWYRDPSGGAVGYNLADALSVTFCP